MNLQINQEPIILFEGVSIRYRVPSERMSGIKEYTIRWLERRLQYKEFWALQDVSFHVQQGEIFGVIGRNGAGKSTMLKVMARVLQPTKGRVVMRGHVAPLLELGAGFHPELTGRENIFLNSALLGHSRSETEKLFDSIVDFAEVGDFIDSPLRTYSTGMVARLGFAVATSIRPEILLVDEVLSVGDAQFQKKCLDRMYSFQRQGTTIVIVSHSLTTIETFCERALWLNNGHIEIIGPATKVTNLYSNTEPQKADNPDNLTYAPPSSTKEYACLTDIGETYSSEHIFNVYQGTISVWIKLKSKHSHRDAVIFHTDDSRYVLFVGSFYSSEREELFGVVVARAGGNRKVIDTFYGKNSFPEVSAHLETSQLDEWHLVTVSWNGYPEGTLCLYIDGQPLGERIYDNRFNDGRPLPQAFAVGMRPRDWVGELVEQDNGTLIDSRPETTLSASPDILEIRDLRLYQRALSQEETMLIFEERDIS